MPTRKNLLTGEGRKSTACTFWLEGEKREMEAEEMGRSKVLLFPSTFSGMDPRGRNVGEPSSGRSSASMCVETERQSSPAARAALTGAVLTELSAQCDLPVGRDAV